MKSQSKMHRKKNNIHSHKLMESKEKTKKYLKLKALRKRNQGKNQGRKEMKMKKKQEKGKNIEYYKRQ